MNAGKAGSELKHRIVSLAPLALLAAGLVFGPAPARAKAIRTTYAQLLVDWVVFHDSEVISAAIHAVPPGGTAPLVVAVSTGQAGETSGGSVLEVIRTGQPALTPGKDPGSYDLVLPLLDANDSTVGALELAFRFHPGQSERKLLERATALRSRLQEITPKLATLFDPYTKGYEPTDTLAQRINQILLEHHPDVNVIAIHITKPGEKFNRVWGINRPDFIGRNSDEIDTDTERTGRIVMQVIPATHRMEVHMPLLSPNGVLIGTLCTVYFWHEVGEASDFYGRSLAIMEEARLITPVNRDDLFRP